MGPTVNIYVCLCVCVCVCIYIYVYINIVCVCIYIYTHTHTHTHTKYTAIQVVTYNTYWLFFHVSPANQSAITNVALGHKIFGHPWLKI